MSNVSALRQEEMSMEEKSILILETVFGQKDPDEVFRVFLNKAEKKGKLYLPLCQSIAGLVNQPVPFPVKVEVREDKTIVHF